MDADDLNAFQDFAPLVERANGRRDDVPYPRAIPPRPRVRPTPLRAVTPLPRRRPRPTMEVDRDLVLLAMCLLVFAVIGAVVIL